MGGRDGVAAERAGVVGRVVAVACLAAVVLSGCGKKGDARLSLGPVKGFSLGSAKAKPFTKRPTAKELYDMVTALYSSFNSAAITREVRMCTAMGGTREVISGPEEYRFERPKRFLMLQSHLGLMSVVDGTKSLYYSIKKKAYVLPDHTSANILQTPSQYLRNPIDDGVHVRLLPDARVGGEEVYVLEMRYPIRLTQPTARPTEDVPKTITRRLYLAKADLLPRRSELVSQWSRKSRWGARRDTAS